MGWHSHPLLRLLVLAAIAAGMFVVAGYAGVSPDWLRATAEGWGPLAPLVYVAAGALLTVAFVPIWVISAASGLLFGLQIGFPVALVGVTVGSVLTFLLGRTIAGAALERWEGERLQRLRRWITARGMMAILIARILPVPSGLINYAGGLTSLPLRTFLLGSFLGFAPRTFAYTAIGGSLEDPNPSTIAAAVMVLLVAFSIGLYLARRDRIAPFKRLSDIE